MAPTELSLRPRGVKFKVFLETQGFCEITVGELLTKSPYKVTTDLNQAFDPGQGRGGRRSRRAERVGASRGARRDKLNGARGHTDMCIYIYI